MTYLIISLQSHIVSRLPMQLRTFAQAPWYNAGTGAKPCAESYHGRQQHRAFIICPSSFSKALDDLLLRLRLIGRWQSAHQFKDGWLDVKPRAGLRLLQQNLVRWQDTYRSALQRLYHTAVADVVVVVAVVAVATAAAAAVAARAQKDFVP